jgi:hypothetical protein
MITILYLIILFDLIYPESQLSFYYSNNNGGISSGSYCGLVLFINNFGSGGYGIFGGVPKKYSYY